VPPVPPALTGLIGWAMIASYVATGP